MLIDSTVGNTWPLNENSQKSDFRFAFGIIEKSSVINITPWFLCRDFFNDFISNQVALRHDYNLGFDNIYGYRCKIETTYYKDDLVLLVDMKGYPINKDNLQLAINNWEEKYGSKSTITQVGNLLVIHYSKFWDNNHILFSIYTFFVRFIINLELNVYDLSLKNLHYSDIDTLGYDPKYPIYMQYDLEKLINNLKSMTWDSTDYLNHIDGILLPNQDQDDDDDDDDNHSISETMYNLHNNGFRDYLKKYGDHYAV